jgi:O-succinylbenzoate synthase
MTTIENQETQSLRDDLHVNVDHEQDDDYDTIPPLEDIHPETVTNAQASASASAANEVEDASAASSESKKHSNGFTIKYELKDAGVKGRGIFTLEDIPYGKKVWGLVEGNHFYYKNES